MKFSVKDLLSRTYADVLVVVAFLLIGFFYFQTPIVGDLVLGGHDNDQPVGVNQDVIQHRAETGETARWTNSIFGGMPTYQISPSYESTDTLSWMSKVYGLGTSGVLNYVFLYLIGFYILMRVLRFRPLTSAFGAIAWAFSSYFFIIIAAGHIWKVLTLGFVPPTIAGLILCYRGKYLWGAFVTAFFAGLQILSNHIQMSYYFGFVMLSLIVAFGVSAFCKCGKKCKAEDASLPKAGEDEDTQGLLPSIDGKRWLRGTAVFVLAGMMGLLANLPNLYHTYTYSKESMRGKSELTKTTKVGNEQVQAPKDGLDYDYITAWSYGVDETLTLMIPDFCGGGSSESLAAMDATQDNTQYQDIMYTTCSAFGMSTEDASPITSAYWGRQPMTVGPVYVGAIIFFLFVLGCFIVRGPLKWGLLAATLISFIFAWGYDVPAITHFLIEHLPLYNKFRTVSSALVMAEFTIPLLAMLALARILRERDMFQQRKNQIYFISSFVLTAGVCLVLWAMPSLVGDLLTVKDNNFINQYIAPNAHLFGYTVADYKAALTSARHDVLASSACTSFLLILLAAALILVYTRVRAVKGWMLVAVLAVVTMLDMWAENKRYLNDDNFTDASHHEAMVQKTPADEMILADTTLHYRVVDPNAVGSNAIAAHHKSIGGYHAAKLRRYNDLMENHIYAEISEMTVRINAVADYLKEEGVVANTPEGRALMQDYLLADSTLATPVLDMLNTKYVIVGRGAYALQNLSACGNAWFVQSLDFVQGANAEIAALHGLDTHTAAVADEAFRAQLDGTALGQGTARLTAMVPDEMKYTVESEQGGVVVFSEVYYPGWTATVDGQEVELGRVNYALRALRVPAGSHEVVLTFRPETLTITNGVAYAMIVGMFLLLVAAIVFGVKKCRKN